MSGFIRMKENVQIPVNGHLVQLKRVRLIRIEGDQGAVARALNFASGFPGRPLHGLPPRVGRNLPPQRPATERFENPRAPGYPLPPGAINNTIPPGEPPNGNLRLLGEVVIDDEGRLYEVLNSRPPLNHGSSNGHPPVEDIAPAGNVRNPMPPTSRNGRHFPPTTRGSAYEKIFADPGLPLQLDFGTFEEELRLCLAHPDQMQPETLLDCSLQVYQLRMPVPFHHLAAVELGDARLAARFRPLTPQKAEILGIPQLFVGGEANRAVACSRLYLLRPAADPTLRPAPPPEPATTNEKNNGAPPPRQGLKEWFGTLKKNGQHVS